MVVASVVAAGAAAVVSAGAADSVTTVVSAVAGASTLVVSVVSVVFCSQEARPAANRTATAETFRRFFILVLGLKSKKSEKRPSYLNSAKVTLKEKTFFTGLPQWA